MGKSKSNTGIGIIDQAVDKVVNEGTNKVGKNVEQSAQRMAMGVGEISKGNFNNVGNTLLEIGLAPMGGMLAGYKAGETPTERRTREYAEKVSGEDALKAAADAQAAADKKQGDINTIVGEMVNSRKRQPGRAATLLTTVGAGSDYGPLLTGRG